MTTNIPRGNGAVKTLEDALMEKVQERLTKAQDLCWNLFGPPSRRSYSQERILGEIRLAITGIREIVRDYKPDDGLPRFLRVPEAANLTGLSPDTIYDLVRSGEMPGKKVGRSVLIPAAALKAWANGGAM